MMPVTGFPPLGLRQTSMEVSEKMGSQVPPPLIQLGGGVDQLLDNEGKYPSDKNFDFG